MIANRQIESEPEIIPTSKNEQDIKSGPRLLVTLPPLTPDESVESGDKIAAFKAAFEEVVAEHPGIQKIRAEQSALIAQTESLQQQSIEAVNTHLDETTHDERIVRGVTRSLKEEPLPKNFMRRFLSSPQRRQKRAGEIKKQVQHPAAEKGRQRAARIQKLTSDLVATQSETQGLNVQEREEQRNLVLQDPQVETVALFAAAYLNGILDLRIREGFFRKAAQKYGNPDMAYAAITDEYKRLQSETNVNISPQRDGGRIKTVGVPDASRTIQLVPNVQKEPEPRFALPIGRIRVLREGRQTTRVLEKLSEEEINQLIADRAKKIAKDTHEVLESDIVIALQKLTRNPELHANGAVKNLKSGRGDIKIMHEGRSVTLNLRSLNVGKTSDISISREDHDRLRIVYALCKNTITTLVLEGIYTHREYTKMFGGS